MEGFLSMVGWASDVCLGTRHRRIGQSFLMVSAFLWLASFLVASAACGQNSQRIESDTRISNFSALEKISGKIVDDRLEPVEAAEVRAWVFARDKETGERKGSFHRILKTDENGMFVVEITEPFGAGLSVSMVVSARSAGCFQQECVNQVLDLSKKHVELNACKITRGVQIRGRVVGPNVGDRNPLNPYVSLHARYADGKHQEQIWDEVECDQDGEFIAVVPAECKLDIQVKAQNFATGSSEHDVKHADGEIDGDLRIVQLGDLKLKQGTIVSGVARRRDGKPAQGVVFGMIEGPLDNPSDVSAAKTDRQGCFRFAAHTGKCTIVALKKCRTRTTENQLQGGLKSAEGYPLFDSRILDLTGQGSEMKIELVEAETITFRGSLQTEAGKPVSRITIQMGWHTEAGLLEVEYFETRGDGRYEFRVPKGRKPSLTIRNMHDDNGIYEASLVEPVSNECVALFYDPSKNKASELKFKPAFNDVDDLNWTMVKQRSVPESFLKQVDDFKDWWKHGD